MPLLEGGRHHQKLAKAGFELGGAAGSAVFLGKQGALPPGREPRATPQGVLAPAAVTTSSGSPVVLYQKRKKLLSNIMSSFYIFSHEARACQFS